MEETKEISKLLPLAPLKSLDEKKVEEFQSEITKLFLENYNVLNLMCQESYFALLTKKICKISNIFSAYPNVNIVQYLPLISILYIISNREPHLDTLPGPCNALLNILTCSSCYDSYRASQGKNIQNRALKGVVRSGNIVFVALLHVEAILILKNLLKQVPVQFSNVRNEGRTKKILAITGVLKTVGFAFSYLSLFKLYYVNYKRQLARPALILSTSQEQYLKRFKALETRRGSLEEKLHHLYGEEVWPTLFNEEGVLAKVGDCGITISPVTFPCVLKCDPKVPHIFNIDQLASFLLSQAESAQSPACPSCRMPLEITQIKLDVELMKLIHKALFSDKETNLQELERSVNEHLVIVEIGNDEEVEETEEERRQKLAKAADNRT